MPEDRVRCPAHDLAGPWECRRLGSISGSTAGPLPGSGGGPGRMRRSGSNPVSPTEDVPGERPVPIFWNRPFRISRRCIQAMSDQPAWLSPRVLLAEDAVHHHGAALYHRADLVPVDLLSDGVRTNLSQVGQGHERLILGNGAQACRSGGRVPDPCATLRLAHPTPLTPEHSCDSSVVLVSDQVCPSIKNRHANLITETNVSVYTDVDRSSIGKYSS